MTRPLVWKGSIPRASSLCGSIGMPTVDLKDTVINVPKNALTARVFYNIGEERVEIATVVSKPPAWVTILRYAACVLIGALAGGAFIWYTR